MSTRLFTFGCSYTYYGLMLTYPWFLAKKFDDTYNLGMPGAGNEYVFHSLIYADQKFKFTKDDVIIIVWSGIFRIDLPNLTPFGNHNYTWRGLGDIDYYNDENEKLKSYYNDDFLIHKSYQYMIMAKEFLELKNICYRFSSLDNLTVLDVFKKSKLYDDTFVNYKGLVPYHEFENDKRHNTNKPIFSGHPNFVAHYRIAQSFAKSINIEIPDETIDWEVVQDKIYIENNLHAQQKLIVHHPNFKEVIINCMDEWQSTEHHAIYPNCHKFNSESSNIYKQILLEVFN